MTKSTEPVTKRVPGYRPNAKMAAGKLLFYLCANQPDLPRFSDNFRSILHVLTRPVRLINTRQKNNLLAAIFAVGQ